MKIIQKFVKTANIVCKVYMFVQQKHLTFVLFVPVEISFHFDDKYWQLNQRPLIQIVKNNGSKKICCRQRF